MFLNCHSFHSLRYGTISLIDLVAEAIKHNIKTLALIDINTITGIYEFYKLCLENNIKPLVGVEIRKENELFYITLAKNAGGISEINTLLTKVNCENIALPKQSPNFQNVTVIYPLNNVPEKLLDNEFIGVRPEELNLLITMRWKSIIQRIECRLF